MNEWQRFSCCFALGASGLWPPGMALAQSGGNGATPAVETIVHEMSKAKAEIRARLRSYTVTRDFKLFGKEKSTVKAEVTADMTFVPPAFKEFTIKRTNGAGLGERIVRQMLEHETRVVKDNNAIDLSLANYSFQFAGEKELDGHRCYVLEMQPRRKERALLRGRVWVDAATYLVHRVEGEPAKALSWWLRNAYIILEYSDVDGMWLQTASESTADVRIVGPHTMTSRDTEYKFGKLAAGARTVEPVRSYVSN